MIQGFTVAVSRSSAAGSATSAASVGAALAQAPQVPPLSLALGSAPPLSSYRMTQTQAASSPAIPRPVLIGGVALLGVVALAFVAKKLKKK